MTLLTGVNNTGGGGFWRKTYKLGLGSSELERMMNLPREDIGDMRVLTIKIRNRQSEEFYLRASSFLKVLVKPVRVKEAQPFYRERRSGVRTKPKGMLADRL